jgi:hypothetical protein
MHRPLLFFFCVAIVSVTISSISTGQDTEAESLRVQGLTPGGLRAFATQSRDVLTVTVINSYSTGRDVRIVVFYTGREEEQYARDLWVPGRASLTTWLPIGPAPPQRAEHSREFEFLLYDRTGGREQLVLPSEDERVRSRAIIYRPRNPTTAFIADTIPEVGEDEIPFVRRWSPATEAYRLTLATRASFRLPEAISIVKDGFLPPTAEAYDGIDHVVLAGNRVAADPVGCAALRKWVQHGGRLWVMLDQIDPEIVAPILGENFDLHIVDRVRLTTVRFHRRIEDPTQVEARELEQPVDFVRVVISEKETLLSLVNGWPASFVRALGRGKVVFTTLGGRAWYRDREARDPPSPYLGDNKLPIALQPLEEVGMQLLGINESPQLAIEEFQPMLMEEIGYSVPSFSQAAAILGVFVLAVLALGVGLRRSQRPERIGWLSSAAAVSAAGVFVALGIMERQSVPSTSAAVMVVDAVPATGEGAVEGLFALYRPESGSIALSSQTGALLDLDFDGLQGQTRRRIQTDTDAWHWEGLALPAGVRTGSFRHTMQSGPISAVARFGVEGVTVRLNTPGFRNISDALIYTPARAPIAMRLDKDGVLSAGPQDVLPGNQYLAGNVLTDRQQRRQDIYRRFLGRSLPAHMEGRDLFFAWSEPESLPLSVADTQRVVGNALLIIPIEYEALPPNTLVSVPRAFIPYRRVVDGQSRQMLMESRFPAEIQVRFQVPPSLLTMRVERAILHGWIRAPSRQLTITGAKEKGSSPLLVVENPAEPFRIEITDNRLLQLDEEGGLNLHLSIAGGEDMDLVWKIEFLGLDLFGQTADRQEN